MAMSVLTKCASASFGFNVRYSGGRPFACGSACHLRKPLSVCGVFQVHFERSCENGRAPSMSRNAYSSFACANPYTCCPLELLKVSFLAAATNWSYVQLPLVGGSTPACLK